MTQTTQILDANDPDALKKAYALLKSGDVVAFPTETVYGLGANGLDPAAVAKIFKAKGRPGDNPLILHVSSIEHAIPLWQTTDERIDLAILLAEHFWPGPLSLVLPAAPDIPKAVTAGLDSVAVRAPAGTVAQKLLKMCDFPVAAPSANLSGRPSPTSAAHVAKTLEGKIAAILDGGATRIGIESTVLDLGSELPQILRPGDISAEAIQAVIGELALGTAGADAPSPGLRHRHYQPKDMQLSLVDEAAIAAAWQQNIAILCFEETANYLSENMGEREAPLLVLPKEARAYSARLYGALYELEQSGPGQLFVESVPQTSEWVAVQNRLLRASAT